MRFPGVGGGTPQPGKALPIAITRGRSKPASDYREQIEAGPGRHIQLSENDVRNLPPNLSQNRTAVRSGPDCTVKRSKHP